MNKDSQLLGEAYNEVKINEAFSSFVISPEASNVMLQLAGGNKILAVIYLLLAYVGIPGLLMAYASYGMQDIKNFASKIWAGIRGRLSLNPEDVIQAASKLKQTLNGPEKGKITSLVNKMKHYIDNGKIAEAQQIADELKLFFTKTEE